MQTTPFFLDIVAQPIRSIFSHVVQGVVYECHGTLAGDVRERPLGGQGALKNPHTYEGQAPYDRTPT